MAANREGAYHLTTYYTQELRKEHNPKLRKENLLNMVRILPIALMAALIAATFAAMVPKAEKESRAQTTSRALKLLPHMLKGGFSRIEQKLELIELMLQVQDFVSMIDADEVTKEKLEEKLGYFKDIVNEKFDVLKEKINAESLIEIVQHAEDKLAQAEEQFEALKQMMDAEELAELMEELKESKVMEKIAEFKLAFDEFVADVKSGVITTEDVIAMIDELKMKITEKFDEMMTMFEAANFDVDQLKENLEEKFDQIDEFDGFEVLDELKDVVEDKIEEVGGYDEVMEKIMEKIMEMFIEM